MIKEDLPSRTASSEEAGCVQQNATTSAKSLTLITRNENLGARCSPRSALTANKPLRVVLSPLLPINFSLTPALKYRTHTLPVFLLLLPAIRSL